MTRDELIAILKANGFKATARDWIAGETVLVTRLEADLGNLVALPGATHVWPSDNELVMLDPPGAEQRFATLESFLQALERHFKAAEERFQGLEAAQASGARVSGVIER